MWNSHIGGDCALAQMLVTDVYLNQIHFMFMELKYLYMFYIIFPFWKISRCLTNTIIREFEVQRWWKVRETQRLSTVKTQHCDNIFTWVTMTWVELWERKWRALLHVRSLQNTHRQPFPIRGCKTGVQEVERDRGDREIEMWRRDWSTLPTGHGQQIHNTYKYEYAFLNFNRICHLCIVLNSLKFSSFLFNGIINVDLWRL